jgi:hypothetical protein
MSVKSLSHDLNSLHDSLLDRITDAVDSHGLDAQSPDVLDCIEGWFGTDVRADFEEWVDES